MLLARRRVVISTCSDQEEENDTLSETSSLCHLLQTTVGRVKVEEPWVLSGESATPRPLGRGAVRTCAVDEATRHLRGKSWSAVTVNMCGAVM